MSTVTKYSFYVESDSFPQENLTPVFELFKNIETGTQNEILPTINNIGDGYYTFDYVWNETSPIAWLIKIDTGLSILGEKYVQMKIEKHDFLPSVSEQILTSSMSIETSANSLEQHAMFLGDLIGRLLDYEEGKWEIVNNNLYIYNNQDEVIRKFALYDSNGAAASRNVMKRLPVAHEGMIPRPLLENY